jgi:hypothetical protein
MAAPVATSAGTRSVAFTADDASSLSGALASGDDAKVRAVLVAGPIMDPEAVQQLVGLGRIAFDPATFRSTSAHTATVSGQVPHPTSGQSHTWTFELQLVGPTWKLLNAYSS